MIVLFNLEEIDRHTFAQAQRVVYNLGAVETFFLQPLVYVQDLMHNHNLGHPMF